MNDINIYFIPIILVSILVTVYPKLKHVLSWSRCFEPKFPRSYAEFPTRHKGHLSALMELFSSNLKIEFLYNFVILCDKCISGDKNRKLRSLALLVQILCASRKFGFSGKILMHMTTEICKNHDFGGYF